MQHMNELTIEHNHGVCILTDVEALPYDYDASKHGGSKFTGHVMRGTVKGGGVTSRLWTASSYTPFKVWEQMDYDIYGRTPYCYDEAAGRWRVSTVSCG